MNQAVSFFSEHKRTRGRECKVNIGFPRKPDQTLDQGKLTKKQESIYVVRFSSLVTIVEVFGEFVRKPASAGLLRHLCVIFLFKNIKPDTRHQRPQKQQQHHRFGLALPPEGRGTPCLKRIPPRRPVHTVETYQKTQSSNFRCGEGVQVKAI